MADFAVIGFDNPTSIKGAITRSYGQSFYEFVANVWIVSDTGSTKDVADKLGLTNGSLGAQGVVMRFDAYSGYGPTAFWAWLSQHTRALTNG